MHAGNRVIVPCNVHREFACHHQPQLSEGFLKIPRGLADIGKPGVSRGRVALVHFIILAG